MDINSNARQGFYNFTMPEAGKGLEAFKAGQEGCEDFEITNENDELNYRLGLAFGAGLNGEKINKEELEPEIYDAYKAGKKQAKGNRFCCLAEKAKGLAKKAKAWFLEWWTGEEQQVETVETEEVETPENFNNANGLKRLKDFIPNKFRNATGMETVKILGIGAGLMFLFMYKERIFGFFSDVGDASKKAVK